MKCDAMISERGVHHGPCSAGTFSCHTRCGYCMAKDTMMGGTCCSMAHISHDCGSSLRCTSSLLLITKSNALVTPDRSLPNRLDRATTPHPLPDLKPGTRHGPIFPLRKSSADARFTSL